MTDEVLTAPVTAPAAPAAPVAAPAPVASPASAGSSRAVNTRPAEVRPVDPGKYPIREDYAAALLRQEMAALAAPEASAPVPDGAVDETGLEASAEILSEAPAAESATAEVADTPAPSTAEEDFDLEPPPLVTPDVLSQLAAENPDFGKLLEADTRLKGQLYKTAREAAELKPYRALFPDMESAQAAQDHSTTWLEVRDTFQGSTTREGTLASLGKIAELSYERDSAGQVVLRDGKPVIGEDFFGFVNHVVALDLEHRARDVAARLEANQYRQGEERARDQQVQQALSLLRDDASPAAAAAEPEALRRRGEELDRREQALEAQRRGAQVEQRRSFESGLQAEAHTRIHDGIARILANVEKQGGAVSPYLQQILPKAIGAKLIAKIQANPALQAQMHSLQRLPTGDASRQRRLAAIDRAVQQYLPEVARAELREAGVQLTQASAARRAKVDAQIDSTHQTEPKGSTGPASGGATMTPNAAFDHAQAEWQRANPGRPFDRLAREDILPRVLQLLTGR